MNWKRRKGMLVHEVFVPYPRLRESMYMWGSLIREFGPNGETPQTVNTSVISGLDKFQVCCYMRLLNCIKLIELKGTDTEIYD